ncbi:MAG: DUF192 domain-containing protein [Bacteroidales bacterium]
MASSRPLFVASLLKHSDVPHVLRNERTGAVLATGLEGAFESRARRRGLLGRDVMAPGAALIIAPCNSIHTFFMRFPIDVVFVRRDGEVVKICRRVPSWRLRLAPRAFAVVEFAAGALDNQAIARGDRLVAAPREPAGLEPRPSTTATV